MGGFYMQGYFFPILTTEKELPFYVESIGVNVFQYHVKREIGYHTPQIIYSTKGEGLLIVDGITYTITPGTVFYLPAHYKHEYYTIGDVWDTHWVSFHGFAVADTLKALRIDSFEVIYTKDITELDNHFKKLYNMSKNGEVYKGYYLSTLLYDFLMQFYRMVKDKKSVASIASNETMNNMINYIDHNYNTTITLKNLCDIVNVTPQHLCRLSHKYLNMRPMEYISRIRLQEAKAKLLYSDLTVNEIARHVGFNNCNYFCQIFKRYELMTPLEFRNTK